MGRGRVCEAKQGHGGGLWDGGNWLAVGWEAWGGSGMGELRGCGIGRARSGSGMKGVTAPPGQGDRAWRWGGQAHWVEPGAMA